MFTDSIAVKRFEQLQNEYGFQTLFETGTHLGVGSLAASKYCPTVCTVEINPEFRAKAEHQWMENGYSESPHEFQPFNEHLFQNGVSLIYSCLGNSPEVLKSWLASKRFVKPFCFYIDSHWCDHLPTLDELAVIALANVPDSVFIFHDFLVPGKESALRCDEYHGVKLSYDFIKDGLNAINPSLKISYNDESESGIGILYATPPL